MYVLLGYHSRMYKFNFAARKCYLREIEAKGHALRAALRKRLEDQEIVRHSRPM